jgi:fibronectin-binding autotransporter adhesin
MMSSISDHLRRCGQYAAILLPVTLLAGIATDAAAATDYYWYGDGSTLGGSGAWNTTSTDWGVSSASGTSTAWSNANDDNAYFAGSLGGSVTLGTTITAHSLYFTTTGYTIASSTLTLGTTTGQSVPSINVADNCSETISSVIAGSTGFTKDGNGALTLSGTNTYTGATVINAGLVQLSATNAINASASITINGGTLSEIYNNGIGGGVGLIARTLTINEGGTLLAATSHMSMSRTLTMVGGTIASTGNGDGYGNVLFTGTGMGTSSNYPNVYNFTSAADGVASVISAGSISLYNGSVTFNVTQGGGSTDLLVTSVIKGGSVLVKSGNGLMTVSGASTYTAATYVTAGTLNVTGSLRTSGIYVTSAGNSFSAGHATIMESLASGGSLISTIVGSDFATATRGTVSSVSAASSVSMSWRNRNSSELSKLISDVANVTDSVSGSSFTLTLSYDVATLTSRGFSASDTSDIYIAYWDGTAWEALASTVNTSNTTVSAVVSGSIAASATQFAVVPEPGALALLAGVSLSLIAFAWRKRRK